MTAIVKKIKVGLSQEEIDELKSSVIDLGTISSSFQSSVCEDLDGLTEIGMYTFKYGNTRYMMNVEKVQTGATTYSTFQYIYTKPDVYFTRVKHGTSWSYSGAKYLVDSTTSVTSGNISNKIFLVGRTSQSITGGTAYSHDTVYVDTDGHLYDSGKRVLTTADSVSGGSTSQSVIDLGTITEDPASATNSVLSEILSTGIYKFEYEYTSGPGITSQAYLMYVFNKYGTLCQNIICSGNQFIQRMYREGEGWTIEEGSFATDSEMVRASKQTTSTNTSNKIFLIGSTSQSLIGTSTYSHDTVYVDTDGHLYDSGKRVLTTADSVSGGAVSGDYLPHHTITVGSPTTPMSTVLSAYGSGLYAITFNGPASGTYIFNVQHQGDTRCGMSAIDINTNATSYYVSKDMSTVTAADFKNSFTSFFKTTGGTITGDLSVAGNLKLNNTRKIVHGNDLYEYTFPKKSGTVALLSDIPSGGGTSEDITDLKENGYYSISNTMPNDEKAQWNVGNTNSELQLIGQNSRPAYYSEDSSDSLVLMGDIFDEDNNIIAKTNNGIKYFDSNSCFGFSDEGEPVIVNTSGYNGFLLGGALDNGAFYEFPVKPDDAGSMYVPCTSSQGSSGQVLTSNGNGTYAWTAQTGGGTVKTVIDVTLDDDGNVTTDFNLNNITFDNSEDFILCLWLGTNYKVYIPITTKDISVENDTEYHTCAMVYSNELHEVVIRYNPTTNGTRYISYKNKHLMNSNYSAVSFAFSKSNTDDNKLFEANSGVYYKEKYLEILRKAKYMYIETINRYLPVSVDWNDVLLNMTGIYSYVSFVTYEFNQSAFTIEISKNAQTVQLRSSSDISGKSDLNVTIYY